MCPIYAAFGELASQSDANGNSHTMTYDLMGRIKDRVGTEGTTLYEYVTANNGKNLIKKVTGFNGILQEYTYDAFNHMTEDKETVDGTAHPTNYTYNTYGDVTSVTYPSGFIVNKLYNTKGFLTELKNAGLTVTLFSASSMNAYGQYTGFTLGNGVASTRTFDDYGFPVNFTATGKQNLSMSFNAQNGNMGSRNDILKGLSESFTYDNLNRLLDATVSGQAAQSATYAPAGTTTGNISTKTGVGSYTYDPLKIHAVTMVTNPGSVVPTGTQTIAYTPYHQPATITDGGDQVAITYGPDYQRRKMTTSKFGSVTGARYYFGSYEKNVAGSTTTHLHYIGCGAGLVAMVHRNNSGGDTYYYTYTDHLGSILTVTDNAGTVQAEQSFDAWGRTRNRSTWAYTGVTGPPVWLYRGFTGHEHLANFGLINMNGRVYDPILGRMLSVDNYAHGSTQGLNRFAYAYNNPLKYTDPTGEIAWAPIIIGAVIGAYMGGALANNNYNPVNWNYQSGKTWGYMGAGLVIGAASGHIGGAIATSGMPMANTAGIAGASFVNSVGTNLYTGGQTDVGVSFGFGSYSFSTGEFGYLGKRGNSGLENVGYGVGALANVADLLAGFQPGTAVLRTENDPRYTKVDAYGNRFPSKDIWGHSQITDENGKILIDWGPVRIRDVDSFVEWYPGTNSYKRGVEIPLSNMKKGWWGPLEIDGVNTGRISGWNPSGKYNILFNSCVSHPSRALNLSGAFNIGIHPYLLHTQMYLRSIGARPMLYSHYLIR